MTVNELRTWVALWELEPWDITTRLEGSIAVGSSAVCNAFGAKVRAEQLIPQWNRQAQRGMDAEEFKAWCEIHNGRLNGLKLDR